MLSNRASKFFHRDSKKMCHAKSISTRVLTTPIGWTYPFFGKTCKFVDETRRGLRKLAPKQLGKQVSP
jgi:hypothetical protein